MIFGDKEIKSLIKDGIIDIHPYEESNVNPASINLTIGKVEDELYSTLERVFISNEICAFFLPRSSFIRSGGIMSTGFIDPGFNGQLTTRLTGFIPEAYSSPFQIVFETSSPSENIYKGKYQGSTGVTK